jgi:DNA-binding NarL/FixJ family response regulator
MRVATSAQHPESTPGIGIPGWRQWEILRRIAAGERVPTIADELFLSHSTVRNHLPAIFDRFGVHFQAALPAAFSRTDTTSG